MKTSQGRNIVTQRKGGEKIARVETHTHTHTHTHTQNTQKRKKF